MIYASINGQRATPFPRALHATCPICSSPVIAKCGRITTWHWAHATGAECDTWAEPDSNWHRNWQNLVPIERREVTIGRHRADLVTASGIAWGTVVEIQHSNLGVDEIHEREQFYGPRMCWVFDAVNAYATHRLPLKVRPGDEVIWDEYNELQQLNLNAEPGDDAWRYRTFRWKHPRKSVAACHRPVFLDIGSGWVLKLGKLFLTDGPPYGGYGWLGTHKELAEAFNRR